MKRSPDCVLAPPERGAAAGLVSQTVRSAEGLQALRAEWEALWRAARASPFQSPAWLLPWWTHVGRGTLASAAFRSGENGTLVGLAPLYVYTDPASGQRHLFPLGVATTDRLDVLVHPAWRAAVASAWHRWLDEVRAEFDVFEAPQLPADAAWLALGAPRDWKVQVGAGNPNPVLPLPARLPAPMARDLAYCRRRAGREGVAYVLAGAAQLAPMLDALMALHAKRWSRRAESGVLHDPLVQAWHRAAAPQLHALGVLRLLALQRNGRPLAVLYALADAPGVHRRRWSYYIGGFDPDVSALSPGTLLVGHAIEQAQQEGAAAFDFLRGEEAYKARWGARPEPMKVLRLWPPGGSA